MLDRNGSLSFLRNCELCGWKAEMGDQMNGQAALLKTDVALRVQHWKRNVPYVGLPVWQALSTTVQKEDRLDQIENRGVWKLG